MPVTLDELHAPPFSKRMEKGGITDEMLIEQHFKELTYGGKRPKPDQMRIRQNARIDAHKLRGDYAPIEHKVGLGETLEEIHRNLFPPKKDE